MPLTAAEAAADWSEEGSSWLVAYAAKSRELSNFGKQPTVTCAEQIRMLQWCSAFHCMCRHAAAPVRSDVRQMHAFSPQPEDLHMCRSSRIVNTAHLMLAFGVVPARDV